MPGDGEGDSRRADGCKRVMWKFLQLSPRCASRVVLSLVVWVQAGRDWIGPGRAPAAPFFFIFGGCCVGEQQDNKKPAEALEAKRP